MANQQGQDKGYTWETEYEKTWEALQLENEGSLQSAIDSLSYQSKQRRIQEKPVHVRLGMMRHLVVVVDMSQSMGDQDLRPTRMLATLKLLELFVDEFFDQNPISQLGVIVTHSKRAEKVMDLGGNLRRHIDALRKLSEKPTEGEPSLQNALELAAQSLKHMPAHSSREVLVILGSLTSCDPRDIHTTIQTMKDLKIRCSAIGLAAEVHVCKKLCMETSGTYNVILNESHFKDLLHSHVTPLPSMTNTDSSLIRMGFPHHQINSDKKPSLCMCHLDAPSQSLAGEGYICPQCKAKYCELPVECIVCGLTLVSPPHLARSYHHLFPLQLYTEVDKTTLEPHKKICYSCQVRCKDQNMFSCTRCSQLFCVDCNIYIHETLHSCPGCASSKSTQINQT